MALSALSTANPSIRPLQLPLKLSPKTFRLNRTLSHPFPFRSQITTRSLKFEEFSNCAWRAYGFGLSKSTGFRLKAQNGEEERNTSAYEAEEEARGQSTMPERFRYLTKEVPDRPVRWPWFVALIFLVYAWRTVLWELSNWKKAAMGVVHLVGYLLKLVLALIFHYIGDHVTSLIRGIETSIYTVQDFCSWINAYVPIRELIVVIVLASTVLSIAESTVPDSVRSQPYILIVSGIIGFAAVRSYISEPVFWLFLIAMFVFGRFIEKRDYVSSLLPVAAVLAAIGEPWVRVVVLISYLGVAISHHYKKPLREMEGGDIQNKGGDIG